MNDTNNSVKPHYKTDPKPSLAPDSGQGSNLSKDYLDRQAHQKQENQFEKDELNRSAKMNEDVQAGIDEDRQLALNEKKTSWDNFNDGIEQARLAAEARRQQQIIADNVAEAQRLADEQLAIARAPGDFVAACRAITDDSLDPAITPPDVIQDNFNALLSAAVAFAKFCLETDD